MKFILRLLITAAALWAATRIVSGISFTGTWVQLLCVALAFGIINALVRPVLTILSLPVVLITFGLFLLVLNGLMLELTSAFSVRLGLGFHVEGFWAAFWGALVVSIVSTALEWLIPGV